MKKIVLATLASVTISCMATYAYGKLVRQMTPITSVDFSSRQATISVKTIETGVIDIRKCHFSNCLGEETNYFLRLGRIVVSGRRNKPIPINTYLLQHPEGNFLIDTGGDSNFQDKSTWGCDKVSGVASRRLARVETYKSEEIVPRLASLGLAPKDIKSAIITHMHFDHTGGIQSLGAKTIVGEQDVVQARIIGSTPCRFVGASKLDFFEAELAKIEAQDPRLVVDEFEPLFGKSLPLTQDGAIRVYSTPGHTPGSLSVRVATDRGNLWFIGDISFSNEGVDMHAHVAGIHNDIPMIRETHDKLRALRDAGGNLLIPAHDKEADKRLKNF